MKSIYQMELEDKFNRKIKYREKKIETQRKVIGKQQEQIFQLRKQLQQKGNIINDFMEELKWQRKVSLSSNETFAVSRIDVLINCLQELKGDGNNE